MSFLVTQSLALSPEAGKWPLSGPALQPPPPARCESPQTPRELFGPNWEPATCQVVATAKGQRPPWEGEGGTARGGIRDLQIKTLSHRPAGFPPGCLSLPWGRFHTFRPHSLRPASPGAPSPAAVLGVVAGQCLQVQESARTSDRQEAQLHEGSPSSLATIHPAWPSPTVSA